jgi:hypothetical protein
MPSAARVLLGIVTAIACLAPLAGTIHVADDALAHAAAGPGGTDDRDPAALLSRFLDARNRGDLDAALALVADDVTYIGGQTCTVSQPCVGRANLRRELFCTVDEASTTALTQPPRTIGPRVQGNALTRGPDLELVGLDRILTTITAEVRDGRFTMYRSDLDELDAESVWWQQHATSLQSAAGCNE